MILDKNYRFPSYHEIINPDSTISIGIFGDSYGKSGLGGIENMWGHILAKKIGVNSYNNYCHGGSGPYYAYNTFLENQNKFDIVIFLATDVHRYHHIIRLESVDNGKTVALSGINNVEHYQKNKKISSNDMSLLESLKHWYLLNVEDYASDMQELMIKEIIRIRPDTIIIPCFEKSLKKDMFTEFGLASNNYMHQLTFVQQKSLGIDPNKKGWAEINETICCHFTKEMNIFFSDIVYDRYITGKWNWIVPDTIPHNHSYDFYYEKIR
jgi:hypothetical protein